MKHLVFARREPFNADSARVGHTIEELLEGHPRLTREGIEAAVQYAIDAVRAERVVAAAGR